MSPTTHSTSYDLLATMHLQSLPKKAGPMTAFFSDGTHSTELFQLSWPNRLRFGAQETDLLQHSHVLSRPDKDQLISGSPSFCLELRPWTRGQSSHIEILSSTFLYAISNDERRDWVSKLRKHAVHYDLQNAYLVTDTILGRGAYGTVFLGKDKIQQTAVALKIIYKSRLNEEEKKLIVSELHISLEVRCQRLKTTSKGSHLLCKLLAARDEATTILPTALDYNLYSCRWTTRFAQRPTNSLNVWIHTS